MRGMTIRILLTAIALFLLMTLPTEQGGGGRRLSAREKRIERARRKDLVRTALRSTATYGYHVFDELTTKEAGMIDFLAIGPVGAVVIVVRDEAGEVTADEDGTLYLDGRRFEDDPNRHAEDLVDDVNEKFSGPTTHTYHVICFTQAELYYLGDDPDSALQGVCPIWDLPLSFANAPREHTPADVAELADHIREVYNRPPFVAPGDAEEAEV